MKRHSIIIAAASLLLASCAEHFVATDIVNRNLDGSRQVLTTSGNTCFKDWQQDSLTTLQVFDFRSDKDTMRYAYTIDIARGRWTIQQDSISTMLQPEVIVGKRFLWFTTRYRYTARFPQLDSLPVAIDEYLTTDEQRLLFTPTELPDDWNGADLYDMLDKLNTKYVKWWSHCLFEKELEAYATCCDSTQKALLSQYHDTLLTLALADQPNEFKSIGNVATAFPELEFINRINNVGFEALQRAKDHWNIDTRVIWRVLLPGGGMVEHMVSADRMIQGDYVIEEHSDVVNWWAVILTLLLIAGGAVLLAKRR